MQIQNILAEWALKGDIQALNQAIPLVQAEIRHVARRCLFGIGRAEIEEEVEDVLSELLLPATGRPHRLLAPGAGDPRYWRLRVIRNALRGRLRERRARNRHRGWTDRDAGENEVEALAELSSMRRRVSRALPELEPTRHLAVAVALGIEPELAFEAEELQARVRAALLGSLPGYRVLFPEGRGEEAWRKLVERGARDLRRAMALEGPPAKPSRRPHGPAATRWRGETRPA